MSIHVDIATRESVAARAPARWLEHYDNPSFQFYDGQTVAGMTPLVEALKVDPTPENVVRVLNESWVRTDDCDSCGSDDSGPRVNLWVGDVGSERSMCLCEVCGQRVRGALSRALAGMSALPVPVPDGDDNG